MTAQDVILANGTWIVRNHQWLPSSQPFFFVKFFVCRVDFFLVPTALLEHAVVADSQPERRRRASKTAFPRGLWEREFRCELVGNRWRTLTSMVQFLSANLGIPLVGPIDYDPARRLVCAPGWGVVWPPLLLLWSRRGRIPPKPMIARSRGRYRPLVLALVLLAGSGCASMRRNAPSPDLRPCDEGFATTADGWKLGIRRVRPIYPDPA
jgi:hypothetical protein